MDKPKTPTTAIVFGVLNFVLMLFGCCLTSSAASLLFVGNTDRHSPPAEAFQKIPGAQVILFVVIATAILANILLLVSGIGLVLGKAWGRSTAIAYAGINITFTLLVTLMTAVMFNLPLTQIAEGKRDAAVVLGITWGLTGGSCCGGLLYPLILGWFMLKLKLPATVPTGAPAPTAPGSRPQA